GSGRRPAIAAASHRAPPPPRPCPAPAPPPPRPRPAPAPPPPRPRPAAVRRGPGLALASPGGGGRRRAQGAGIVLGVLGPGPAAQSPTAPSEGTTPPHSQTRTRGRNHQTSGRVGHCRETSLRGPQPRVALGPGALGHIKCIHGHHVTAQGAPSTPTAGLSELCLHAYDCTAEQGVENAFLISYLSNSDVTRGMCLAMIINNASGRCDNEGVDPLLTVRSI
ncbi:Sodium- and chloride-dependent glycine transporter 2, partial [Frankliniella fusca]